MRNMDTAATYLQVQSLPRDHPFFSFFLFFYVLHSYAILYTYHFNYMQVISCADEKQEMLLTKRLRSCETHYHNSFGILRPIWERYILAECAAHLHTL